MHSLCRCRTLTPGALVLSLLLAGPALLALAGDPLDEVKARQEVDAKRVQSVVADALKDAARLAQARKPADAAAVLRSALAQVEDCTALTEERRASLKRELNLSIRSYEFEAKVPPPGPVNTPVTRSTTPPANDKGPTNAAQSRIEGTRVALESGKALKQERENAYRGVQTEIVKSATPVVMDYNLPKDWLEKSKRRSKQVQLTERERAILRELNTVRSVDFKGETFQEVINTLSKLTGQTITIPKNILEEAGVTYDTPIKLEMKNVTMRSILKKMLADLNLTYIVREEAIEVITPERASRTLTTRTYYVGDLLAVTATNPFMMAQQINSLAAMIINTYEPESWQARGGPGSITFDPITMTFVVRQTAEMHYLMGVGMR